MFERLDGLGATARGRRPKQVAGGGQERVRRDSFAGPDLPVRFSRISIASNQDSKDPWSQRSESSCDSSGHVAAPSPLTSSDFRQRADKDRSFTGSAPPGVRPPTKGGAGLFGAPTNDEDEIDCDEPRRDSGSAPVTRPPPSVRARPLGGFACTPRPHCLRAHSQHSHRDSTVSIPSPKTNPRLCFHTHPPPLPPRCGLGGICAMIGGGASSFSSVSMIRPVAASLGSKLSSSSFFKGSALPLQ